jgi:hypothetical protein
MTAQAQALASRINERIYGHRLHAWVPLYKDQ